MELYINGKKAVKGQEVTDFRGEKCFLAGWKEPHKSSSQGKVHVKKNLNDDNYNVREYYPSVFGGKFELTIDEIEYHIFSLEEDIKGYREAAHEEDCPQTIDHINNVMIAALQEKIEELNPLLKNAILRKLDNLKQKYIDVLDDIHVEKANGELAKLCNLRDSFDETFDGFFDREELRAKYPNAWDSEKDLPNYDISNGDLEKMLNLDDLKRLITFYEGYICDLEDELIDIKAE